MLIHQYIAKHFVVFNQLPVVKIVNFLMIRLNITWL